MHKSHASPINRNVPITKTTTTTTTTFSVLVLYNLYKYKTHTHTKEVQILSLEVKKLGSLRVSVQLLKEMTTLKNNKNID